MPITVAGPHRYEARVLPFVTPDDAHDVSVAAFELGSMNDIVAELSSEAVPRPAWLARAAPRRVAEFLAGRRACALALEACGCACPAPVARNADGSPAWPAGFVGSLTHGAGLATALAAPRSRYESLGIDAEYVLSAAAEAEVRSTIASPEELRRLESVAKRPLGRALLTIVFSAKESVFKCLYPLVGNLFGFEHAEIIELSAAADGTGDFRIRLVRPLGGRFAAGWEHRGRFSVTGARVQTAIGIRA